jgi:plasmid maintenance system antidote protein VapI
MSLDRKLSPCSERREIGRHPRLKTELAKLTTLRVAAVLGTTAQYWLNLQNAVDLYDAERPWPRAPTGRP